MTKIAVSIRPRNYEHGEDLLLCSQIAEADLVELWCDRLSLDDAKKLVVVSELPIVANLKDSSEHGDWTGNLFERIKFLESLLKEGAQYIDLPYSKELQGIDLDRLKSQLLLSWHNFENTPSLYEIEELINEMLSLNTAFIKLAFQVNKEIDLINLLKLQTNRVDLWGKSIIIGMGKLGTVSRVLASAFKQPWTFASLDTYSKTAPGQIPIAVLKKIKSRWGLS